MAKRGAGQQPGSGCYPEARATAARPRSASSLGPLSILMGVRLARVGAIVGSTANSLLREKAGPLGRKPASRSTPILCQCCIRFAPYPVRFVAAALGSTRWLFFGTPIFTTRPPVIVRCRQDARRPGDPRLACPGELLEFSHDGHDFVIPARTPSHSVIYYRESQADACIPRKASEGQIGRKDIPDRAAAVGAAAKRAQFPAGIP